MQGMFRRHLTIALALLATASALQGAAALWALGVADHHAEHSRVTSDIHLGFVELSATKQRLRTWVSQALLGAGAAPEERMRLQAELAAKIERLRGLSDQAIVLGKDLGEDDRQVQFARREALEVLDRGVARLGQAIDTVHPLPPGANAQEAWNALTTVFEESEGGNLRELIARSIARAAASVQRERAAADRTLQWMRRLWMGTAGALALSALLLAWHFARALRRPLIELSAGAAALQRGDLAHRIPAQRQDEFSAVARSVNALAAELQQHRQGEEQARLKLQDLVDARTAELRQALDSLQQADTRRRQLFADISHELRTPTTAIRGEAEVALRGQQQTADNYRAALARIVDTSRQLGLVINDLLTMARSDIDALALQRLPLDPAAPLREALSQITPLALERGVLIDSVPSVPAGLSVLADGQRLRQLILLLLDNAVRYSHPGGRVSLRLHTVLDDAGRDHAELCVSDQGIGIGADELPHIFERNFRGAQARVHRADGTGLGLAIAAVLARAHGGTLRVDSPPGSGSTATLRLPLLSDPDHLLPAP
jgi:two-component system, OmpR family, sensor kinase